MKRIDKLLNKSYYIIDFFPMQVPKESNGQFFEVETYLLRHFKRYGLQNKFIGIILKLMCYYRISVFENEEWMEQPSPEVIIRFVEKIMQHHSGTMNVLFTEKEALLVVDGDCLHLTIYNPDEEMCILLKDIAASEGMFFRKGVEDIINENV